MYPEVVNARFREFIATEAQVFLTAFGNSAGTEMDPWLHDMTVPSLILKGENDSECDPRLNRNVNAAMRHSELVILPKYKHSILLEAGVLQKKSYGF